MSAARVDGPVRWLDTGSGDCAWNMAVDVLLLEAARREPAVRVYGWDPPAVSLGRFQRPDEVPPALRGFPLVRRPSGGGAILHRRELTYAVALPVGRLGCGGRAGLEESYRFLHQAVRAALLSLGVSLDPPDDGPGAPAPTAADRPPARRSAAPFLCFARHASFDLRVGGEKLVGSAQRRRAGALLQHGSIPLGSEANAPGATALGRVLGAPVSYERLAARLRAAFSELLGCALVDRPLADAERRRARAEAGSYCIDPCYEGGCAAFGAGTDARGEDPSP